MLIESGSFPVQGEPRDHLREWKRVGKQVGAGSDAGQGRVRKKQGGGLGWVGSVATRRACGNWMVREQRGGVGVEVQSSGHLRGDVFRVQEVERLPGRKETGGGPSRMGGREPSSGLDQGPWSRSHKDPWLGV